MGTENRTACHKPTHRGAAAVRSAAGCLNGTSTVWVGNSETIELLEWLMTALSCCHRGLRLVSRFKYCTRKSADFRKTALCKERLYAREPYSATCSMFGPPNSTRLDFRWKTDMRSAPFDEGTRSLVLQRAAAGRRTILLLSGGPAHFTRHADYTRGLNSLVPEHFEIPRRWLEDYVNQTSHLLRLFSPASLPPHVCVLWVPIHISVRHNGSGAHHPSTVGGLHDSINQLTASLASRHGVSPLETTSLLQQLRPKGFRDADAFGRGGSEGDPYHGFPTAAFAPQMLQQVCRACEQLQWG